MWPSLVVGERPKKKQKNDKKSSAPPKKKSHKKKRKEESEESDEDNSDSDVPKKKNSKKKAVNFDDEASFEPESDDYESADDWAELVPGKKSNLADLKVTALKKLLASADTSSYQSLGEEEYTLPDELVLQIFTGLTRKQLHAVGLTCRQWLRLTHDQSLGWHLAHSVVLREDPYHYFEELREKGGHLDRRGLSNLPADEKYATLQQYKSKYLQTRTSAPTTVLPIRYESTVKLNDEHGHTIRCAEVINDKFNHRFIGIDWTQLNSDPELWSYRIHKATIKEVTELNGYSAYTNERPSLIDQWIVDIEINIKRLEELVVKCDTSCDEFGERGKATPIPEVKLIYKLVELDFLQRLANISAAKFSSIPRRSFTAQQQPEGFKDEIKLYKYQLDAISWMKSVEDNKDGLPYFTAYPWRRAKTELVFDVAKKQIVTDLEAYVDVAKPKGGVLADEMGLGKTMEMIGLVLANPAPTEMLEHPTLFTSRATLVLCPNHLAKQWSDELTKVTDLKVAVVTTIVQLRKFSYEDFVNYDVVIVSYQLMQNPNYFFLGSSVAKKTNVKKRQELERTAWVETSLETVKSSKNGGLAKVCPIIEHFYWYRIVLDEGHEYLHVPYFKYVIGTYQSRYSWYVTGTPFPHLGHFARVKEFLGLEIPDPSKANNYWGHRQAWGEQKQSTLTDLLLRELYWRHTKETVKGEYQIPDCVEDLVLMDFDEIESVLYSDARDEGAQSRICGSILHDTGLDDRLAHLITRKEGSIPALKKSIPNLVKAVAASRRRYEDERDALAKSVAQSVLKKQEDQLAESEQQLAHDKKVLEMAKKVVPFKKRPPKTKTDLTDLISQHGTKLSQMIVYLRKLFEHKPKSRVIFFSQFNDTLNSVSAILTDHNIDNVFVEGNVFKRNKAISSFRKEDDIKVIMLSLRNAASGTNLIEATHVILMDPVTGSKKEAQAIESQAIGRAHRQGQTKQITIVRFVVRNTIEHALYLRNNDVNEDTTVVVTKDNKPQLVKTASLTSLVAANTTLQRSGSFARPLEENNTNVLPSNNNDAMDD
eukprot:TRINITY_DN4297_c1_g1_i1.p1 TRINITY_DN4297_c1_g1~~TRINITY_DN4297_c1_g1_i1.p1  ORF type:complete len:1047 (+),score=234.72 TRINITY_DN4297_c1_g1_i1:95-3235(+)